MLTIQNLTVYYGRIPGLNGASLRVNPSEIVSIIGPNGAGKSTLLMTIMGVLRPRAGSILLNGCPLPPRPDQVASRGLALVPERRRLFANLSVKENLLMGAYLRPWNSATFHDMTEVFSLFPVLEQRIDQSAATLSGGEQQMLAIGRALMARPKVLLLDEPSLGLAPALTTEVFKTISRIKSRGTTVLLAEQNALKALELADRAYVMETGQVVLEGTAKEVLDNPRVREVYLGVRR